MISTLPGRTYSAALKRRSRIAFSWDARDLSLTARTGQVGVFTRNSIATAIDRYGRIRVLGTNQPKWQWEDRDGDGVREEVVLLMEPQSKNLVASSDDLSAAAGWTLSGITSVTPNAGTFAGRPFSRVISPSNTAFISRTVGFTGDGVKALSFLVRANTSTGATGSDVYLLHDVTANQERAELRSQFNADGTVTFFQNTGWAGTFFIERLADGAYRVHVVSTSVVASHTHTLYIINIPGTIGSGGVTDRYYSGVQAEDFPFPTSLIPTAGSQVTRQLEGMRWPFAQLPLQHAIYESHIERSVGIDTRRFVAISNSSPSVSNILHTGSSFEHEWGGPDSNSGVGIASTPAFRDWVECNAQWIANDQTPAGGGTSKFELSVNRGSIASTQAFASRLPATWLDQGIALNAISSAQLAPVGFSSIRVASPRPMLDMRAVL